MNQPHPSKGAPSGATQKEINMMILMRLIYSVFKSFVLIYINIYLWKVGKSMQAVAVFNIANYFAATVSFYVGNMIALKNMRYNYILSSLSFMVAFGLTGLFSETISSYAILIGLLGGTGDGLFFFNLNSFQSSQLDTESIDRFMSINGALSKASAIITPVVSGFVIEFYGFRVMTAILFGFIVVQFLLSLNMSSHSITVLGRVNVKKVFRRDAYHKVLLSNLLMPPYSQFTAIANSVFLYSFVVRESLIGVINSAFSVFSILMFIVYRRTLRLASRRKVMGLGALACAIVILLVFQPSMYTFIAYGLLTSIGAAFFQTPLVGVQLRSAKKHSVDEGDMLGNLMLRVILLNTGRVAFFTLMYFFYTDYTSPIFTILLVYNMMVPLVSYRIVREEI